MKKMNNFMKTIINITVCLFFLAITLQSCNEHKNEKVSNTFVGVWEMSSKDDVIEEGIGIEHILELKEGNIFSEKYSFYENNELLAEVSIDGEYGVEVTNKQAIRINMFVSKKTDTSSKVYTLWRKYNIDSIDIEVEEVEHDSEELSELIEVIEEGFTNENQRLADADKEGIVYGLVDARVEDELSWLTDEPISEDEPDYKRRATAKRILKSSTVKIPKENQE